MRFSVAFLFLLLSFSVVVAEEKAPVFYVNFDSDSATALTGQSGKVSGVTFTSDNVYSGSVASFLEQGDQIVYDSPFLHDAPFFTVSFAMHAERDTEKFSLLALGDNYHRDYGFAITQLEDTIQFDVRKNRQLHETIYTTSDLDLSEVKWSVLTFVYDNTTLRSYVNGKLEKEKAYDKGFAATYPLRLGATDPAFAFQGQLDEIAIFDYVLSDSQIARLGANSTAFLSQLSLAAPAKKEKKEPLQKQPTAEVPVTPEPTTPPVVEPAVPVAPLPAQAPPTPPPVAPAPAVAAPAAGVSVGTIAGIVGVAFLTMVAVLAVLLVHKKKKKAQEAAALKKQQEEEEARKKVEEAKRKEEETKKAQEKKGPVLASGASVDARLVQFIANALQKGSTPSQIYTTLLQKGWKKEQIDAAFLQSRRPS